MVITSLAHALEPIKCFVFDTTDGDDGETIAAKQNKEFFGNGYLVVTKRGGTCTNTAFLVSQNNSTWFAPRYPFTNADIGTDLNASSQFVIQGGFLFMKVTFGTLALDCDINLTFCAPSLR